MVMLRIDRIRTSSEEHPPSERWASGGVLDIVDPHACPPHSRIGNVIRRKFSVEFGPKWLGGAMGGKISIGISRASAFRPLTAPTTPGSSGESESAAAHGGRNVWGFNRIVHTQKGYGYV
jgi:hypothetical protein